MASVRASASERLNLAQVAGHQEGGHLVVGQFPAGVGEHELAQLVAGDLSAVALAGDDVERPHSPAHREAFDQGASAPSRSSSERTWARAW